MMTVKGEQAHFGLLLRSVLEERSMSMRELSDLTEIDNATISRIINGKRNATLQHLEKIANSLQMPLSELMSTSEKIPNERSKEIPINLNNFIDEIQPALDSSEIFNQPIFINKLELELKKYEQYAQTIEGKKLIADRFTEKLEKVDSIGPFIDQLKELYERYRIRKGSQSDLLLIGAALTYFIVPLDVIPDYIFPIGYLDDAIIVQKVAAKLIGKYKKE